MGAALTAQTGAQNLQQLKQATTQQNAYGQTQLSESGRQNRQELARRHIALQNEERGMRQQLADMDRDVKNKVFDDELQFRRDTLGRTIFSQKQLMDYAVLKATNDEQLRDYENTMAQGYMYKQAMYNQSKALIEQELRKQFTIDEQDRDQKHTLRLQNALTRIQNEMNQIQTDANNTASMWQAGGAIIGGIGGAIAGTFAGMPVQGAMAGAGLGGGLGTMAGGAMSSSTARGRYGTMNTKV
jgi:hypothetical protein